jgi:hypothetical protein
MNALIGAVVGALLSAPLAFFFGLERSRHERLEEKRALVIADPSRLLFEVQDTFSHWAHLSLHSEPYEHVANLAPWSRRVCEVKDGSGCPGYSAC